MRATSTRSLYAEIAPNQGAQRKLWTRDGVYYFCSLVFAGRRLCRIVAHRFDVVAIRVEHERSVIIGVVDFPHAGWAVVFAAGL